MGHIENELGLYKYILENLKFEKEWESKSCDNDYVQHVLNKASKKDTGFQGQPDLIYCNDENKLLILLENKPSISFHSSRGGGSLILLNMR